MELSTSPSVPLGAPRSAALPPGAPAGGTLAGPLARCWASVPLSILLVLGLLAGCVSSYEDYLHPQPDVPHRPDAVEPALQPVELAYDARFDPLPVVEVQLEGRPARALIGTRHSWSAVAEGRVSTDTPVLGIATLPVLHGDALEAVERSIVRIESVELGGTKLQGLPCMVEPLPAGIDLLLAPAALAGFVWTFDGPTRLLRLEAGALPRPREGARDTVSLSLEFLMGYGAARAPRFWATIEAVLATELDGGLLVGASTSTVIETQRGPELLPLGPDALEPLVLGSREVRMDGVFGEDRERTHATEVRGLGSGFLVLGAGYLADHVLQLDPTERLARLR